MYATLSSFVFFVCLDAVLCNFVGMNGTRNGRSQRMSAMDVVSNLNESIESVMGNHGPEGSKRVAKIGKSIAYSFQSLPKNKLGRLDPPSVRYIVHNYFAREHGWLLVGLVGHHVQVHGNTSEVHDATILQELAPALVESLLGDQQHGRGLSFEDVVVMIADIERLCVQNSISLLRTAYLLNNLDASDKMDKRSLHEVLRSFLLIFRSKLHGTLNLDRHHELELKLAATPLWNDIVEFETDAVANKGFECQGSANPFVPPSFSFDEASEIVETMTHNYGKWSNKDCTDMKEHLMSLDSQGTGRVSLERFYEPSGTSLYRFEESRDYLRSIGALDEQFQQVLIANYVVGASNCIVNSAHYSVCCMNECEVLMNEIEAKVKAPTASPDQLLRVVSNIQSTTVDAPRQLPVRLPAMLREAGERNEGVIHLHGRLFAQFLHFAFPHECPYPSETSVMALTPSQWLHVSSEEVLSQWSDEEVLPLEIPPSAGAMVGLLSCFGWTVRLLPIVLLTRSLWSAWKLARRAHRTSPDMPKDLGQFI